jgi:hypothetical protein
VAGYFELGRPIAPYGSTVKDKKCLDQLSEYELHRMGFLLRGVRPTEVVLGGVFAIGCKVRVFKPAEGYKLSTTPCFEGKVKLSVPVVRFYRIK